LSAGQQNYRAEKSCSYMRVTYSVADTLFESSRFKEKIMQETL